MKRLSATPNASYSARRRAAYAAEIPDHEILEAMLEAQAGRPERLADVEARRSAIKARFPKPST